MVVVSLGWCELADEDLTPENSSKAVNRSWNGDCDDGDGGDQGDINCGASSQADFILKFSLKVLKFSFLPSPAGRLET